MIQALCYLSWFCWLLNVEPNQHERSLEEVQIKLIESLKNTNSAAKRLTEAYKGMLEAENASYAQVFPTGDCRLFATATYMLSDESMLLGSYMVRPKSFNIVDQDGKVLVEISLKDGKVKLHGNPNKAAKIFWKAVGRPENMR